MVSEEITLSINVFWGSKTFEHKIEHFKQVKPAFIYWILNVIEQNRTCKNFLKILSNLKEQIRRFLYNQWGVMISNSFSDYICLFIVQYLRTSLSESDTFHKFGIDFMDFLPPPELKHSQRLRIRGLMHRSGNERIQSNSIS